MGGPVAVLGAGAWGTALACAFLRAGCEVRLWARDPALAATMAATRENHARLPGVPLDPAMAVTADLAAATAGSDLIVAAVPAQAMRALAERLAALGALNGVPIVNSAKGIERRTGLFPTQVLADTLPGCPAAILSGPSFAADVGRGLPTAVTLGAAEPGLAAAIAARLGSATLRIYHTDDVRGVEIGGAAKNVLAIACGIASGRGLGASAVAALTARAFAELSRFGRALGGRADTLAGLAGLGDLVLTCSSPQSRNFSHGLALGRGETPSAEGGPVVEGVWTAPILVELARRAGIDMPVCEAVAAVVAGALSVDGAVDRLMRRPLKAEG